MAARIFRVVAQNTTNLNQVTGTQGNFAGLQIVNTTAAIIYVKLYDSTNTPTIGTTLPKLTFQVAASSSLFVNPTEPIAFQNAIWLATTANAVDSDTTAIGSGPILQVFYE